MNCDSAVQQLFHSTNATLQPKGKISCSFLSTAAMTYRLVVNYQIHQQMFWSVTEKEYSLILASLVGTYSGFFTPLRQ